MLRPIFFVAGFLWGLLRELGPAIIVGLVVLAALIGVGRLKEMHMGAVMCSTSATLTSLVLTLATVGFLGIAACGAAIFYGLWQLRNERRG